MRIVGTIGRDTPPMMERFIYDLYRAAESKPEYLFMRDGGPEGTKAHVVVARLVGFDEQVIDHWRIDYATHKLVTPHRERLTHAHLETPVGPALRSDEYLLQSSYTRGWISASAVDDATIKWIGADPDPATFQWEILALWYKRR